MAKGNRKWQLYDLGSDPNETTDVAAEKPGIVEELAALAKVSRVESEVFKLPTN
jgi:hypothetical protein